MAKYVEFLKEENKILRVGFPGQVHTKPDERTRLVQLGKALWSGGRRIADDRLGVDVLSLVSRREGGKKKTNPKGGQRKPREIRELVLEIAKLTGFGYTRIIGEIAQIGDQRHQSPDGAEHPQGRRDRASTRSDIGQMGELPGTPPEHAMGSGFLLGEVGDHARHPGSVCARISVPAQS